MTGSITALTAGILALFFLAMTFWVIAGRFTHKVELGDGGHKDLQMRIRAHANFAEYVPLCLILMFFVEAGGGARWLPLLMGILLVFARVAHAIGVGVIEKPGPFRLAGTATTNIVLAIGGVTLIARALG